MSKGHINNYAAGINRYNSRRNKKLSNTHDTGERSKDTCKPSETGFAISEKKHKVEG